MAMKMGIQVGMGAGQSMLGQGRVMVGRRAGGGGGGGG